MEAQSQGRLNQLFTPADTFNKARFWALNGTAAVGYSGAVYGLSQIWYAQFEQSSFHFFNDMGEWKDMDKAGHLFTAYFETKWATQAYRWTGVENKKAIWLGGMVGTLFQSTIEVMDGFSAKWGFSLGDFAFNTAGSALYMGQEFTWGEQRILLKYSAHLVDHPDLTVAHSDGTRYPLRQRVDELYGTSFPELILKDYNGVTVWVSGNIHAFLPEDKKGRFPPWLNVAVGYGAENMYGGFANEWEDEAGRTFILPSNDLEPVRQFYLAPDIDFTKIKTRHKSLKFFFSLLNVLKMPSPALELNSKGKLKFHPFYF